MRLFADAMVAEMRSVRQGSWLLAVAAAVLLTHTTAVAQPNTPDQLRQRYGRSIFYVDIPSGAPGKWDRAGTATLIDSRGYFVTASHTLAATVEGPDECDKRQAFKGVLRLTNEDGIVLQGQEMAGFPHGLLDLSLIVAQVPADKAISLRKINLPNAAVGDPSFALRDATATLIAYEFQSDTLTLNPQFTTLSVPQGGRKPITLPTPYAFNGNSGGPALTPDGWIAGVLIGPEVASCDNRIVADTGGEQSNILLKFTGLSSADSRRMLLQIPEDALARALADALEDKTADYEPLEIALSKDAVPALTLLKAASLLHPQSGTAATPINLIIKPPSGTPLNRDAKVRLVDLAVAAARKAGMLIPADIFARFCPSPIGPEDTSCVETQLSTPMYIAANTSLSLNFSEEDSDPQTWAAARLAEVAASPQFAAYERKSPASASDSLTTLATLYTADFEHQPAAAALYKRAVALNGKNVGARYALYKFNLWQGKAGAARAIGVELVNELKVDKSFQVGADARTLSNEQVGVLLDSWATKENAVNPRVVLPSWTVPTMANVPIQRTDTPG